MSPADFTNGIVISIGPVAASLGPASIRWLGVAIALGIAAGLLVALRLGRERGVPESDVYALALAGTVAGLVGARALHVVDKLDYYLQNPYYLLSPSQVSMASWGALLFGGAAVVFYARRRAITPSTALDVGIPAFLVGQIVGRVGSLINGESWGSPTSLPWAITYLNGDAMLPPGRLGIPTHPYAAYEMLWTALAVVIAWRFAKRLREPGTLSATALLLYSAGRLVLGQFREEGAFLWGMQQAQVIAVLVMLVCLPWLAYLLSEPRRKVTSPGQGKVRGRPVL